MKNILNTKITFNVESDLLRDYLGYLFERNDHGEYIVTARNDLGKLLIAHLQPADKIPPTTPADRSVTLVMPTNRATMNFRNKFTCYSSQSTVQLNHALTAIFNMDFWTYSLRGKSLRLRKDEMIEAFIYSRKLFSRDLFDTLNKRAYRKDLEILKLLTEKLKNRYYYIDGLYRK